MSSGKPTETTPIPGRTGCVQLAARLDLDVGCATMTARGTAMTSREVLMHEIESLSEEDAEILVALARRLRAKPLPIQGAQPQKFAATARPNTAPLAGSIIMRGDMVAPVGDPWEADT